FGPDDQKLRAIAEAGGGQVLTSPADSFLRDSFSTTTVHPWGQLAVLALGLLVLEVGIRRLGLFFLPLKNVVEPLQALTALRPLAERHEALAGTEASREQILDIGRKS